MKEKERNMWGVLLAWCFLLGSEHKLAYLTLFITVIFMLSSLSLKRIGVIFFNFFIFILFNYFLARLLELDIDLIFNLLLSIDYALSKELNMQIDYDYDAYLWLFLTLIFYAINLLIPSSYLLNNLRLDCFKHISYIFLPKAIIYLAYIFLKNHRQAYL